MRLIKFRGKGENGNLVYGNLYKSGFIIGIIEHELIGLNYTVVDPETVGQFIGVKDEAGKEIYEGDIIKDILTGQKGEVNFFKGNFLYGDNLIKTIDSFKIIGNIHT